MAYYYGCFVASAFLRLTGRNHRLPLAVALRETSHIDAEPPMRHATIWFVWIRRCEIEGESSDERSNL